VSKHEPVISEQKPVWPSSIAIVNLLPWLIVSLVFGSQDEVVLWVVPGPPFEGFFLFVAGLDFAGRLSVLDVCLKAVLELAEVEVWVWLCKEGDEVLFFGLAGYILNFLYEGFAVFVFWVDKLSSLLFPFFFELLPGFLTFFALFLDFCHFMVVWLLFFFRFAAFFAWLVWRVIVFLFWGRYDVEFPGEFAYFFYRTKVLGSHFFLVKSQRCVCVTSELIINLELFELFLSGFIPISEIEHHFASCLVKFHFFIYLVFICKMKPWVEHLILCVWVMVISQVCKWNHHSSREWPSKASWNDHVICVKEHFFGHVSKLRILHKRLKVDELFLGVFSVLSYLSNE